MVFGRKTNRGTLSESFQSVDSSGSEFELDDPRPALIRGRQRSDGAESRPRSRSSSAARRIAATVAKFSAKRKTGISDVVQQNEQESPSPAAPSPAGMNTGSPVTSPRRRWQSKTSCKIEGEDVKQQSTLDVVERTEPRSEEVKEIPSFLATPSFDMDETPLSPSKSPRRRFRSPVKEKKLHLPNSPGLEEDNENDDASAYGGSVVASVVSMFEWVTNSPRRSPRKLCLEAPESSDGTQKLYMEVTDASDRSLSASNQSPKSSSTTPERYQQPRSPAKTGKVSASRLSADDTSKAFFTLGADGNVIPAVVDSPSKQRTLSKISRRRIRSKTPDSRRGQRHQAPESQSISEGSRHVKPVSRLSPNPVEEPTEVDFHDSSSALSAISAMSDSSDYSSRSGRPTLLAAPSQTSIQANNRPNLVAKQASSRAEMSRPAQFSPPSKTGIAKTSSHRSVTGILRNSSNHSRGGSGAKWCNANPKVSNNDDMSQIIEAELDMEKAVMASIPPYISHLGSGKLALRDQQKDGPSLAQDVQKWRENRLNQRSTTKSMSISERGTRSSVGLPNLNDNNKNNASKIVASLVSPRKRTSRNIRTMAKAGNGGALPVVLSLQGPDADVESGWRSRDSASVGADRVRGRSRGRASSKNSTGKLSRSDLRESISKVSSSEMVRGSSAGRKATSQTDRTLTPRRSRDSSRHSERRPSSKSLRSSTHAGERSPIDQHESSSRKSEKIDILACSPCVRVSSQSRARTSSESNIDGERTDRNTRRAVKKAGENRSRFRTSSESNLDGDIAERNLRRTVKQSAGKQSADMPEKVDAERPRTPSRRRTKIVADTLDSPSEGRANVRANAGGHTSSRRRADHRSYQQEIVSEHSGLYSKSKKNEIADDLKRDTEEDQKTRRSRSPTGNSRLRSKSAGRKTPMTSRTSTKIDGLATPKRPSTRFVDPLTGIDADTGGNTKSTRMIREPNGQLRRARSKVVAKTISGIGSCHSNGVSTEVNLKKNPHKQGDDGLRCVAQLQIPSFAESDVVSLHVEYGDAPKAQVAS